MKSLKTKAVKQTHQYRLDVDGTPCPVWLKDVPAQGYAWGNMSGLALVVDLFNWRKVLTDDEAENFAAEYVRIMIDRASRELAEPHDDSNYHKDHRGVAVGMLDGFAALVAHALGSDAMRDFMVKLLNDTVMRHEQAEADEQAKEKALALNIHGIAHQKGGPRHE